MFERTIRPVTMNNDERADFVRKAKADKLAYEAAELLSLGETSKALALAGECRTLAGLQQSALWVRHYATTRFKVASGAVDAFLGNMPPTEVAL